MPTGKLYETNKVKIFRSDDCNFNFRKSDGFTQTWGKTEAEDPDWCPAGPMIADIEITDICAGPTGKKPCAFCYKSNTLSGTNMSIQTYMKVFEKLPKVVSQIAFGGDAQATSNPDLQKIMWYTREHGVIPNITVANISDETADWLSKVAGAVAVSRYEDKNLCYDTVKRLTDRGLSQTNIHILVSKETLPWILETLEDRTTDPRLSKLNAIVFLSLKKKGRGTSFTSITQEEFKSIVDKAMELKVSFGFDSCSCGKFLESVKDHPKYAQFKEMAEPCESSLFSTYISVSGSWFPCSFTEGYDNWTTGLDVVNCQDFVKDIWNHPRAKDFRTKLLATASNNKLGCRTCPLFEV